MNSESFCYWLHGYFELSGVTKLDEAQVKMIKEHLALVFTKVTPELIEKKKPLKDPIKDNIVEDPATIKWDKETLDRLAKETEEIAKAMNARTRSYCGGDWSGAKIC